MREKKNKLPLLYSTDSRGSADMYTRDEIISRPPEGVRYSIYGDKKYWAAFRDCYTLTCIGSKIFWKKTVSNNATFKDGKIYGNLDMFIPSIIKVFNYNWIEDNAWTKRLLQTRKDLWKMVLSGKITNPESLCKTFSRKYFKGAYSYATLRLYADKYPGAPLWDLYYYTTNPEEALKKYCTLGNYSLFSDSLLYAKILNTKINPLWSEKRLTEVHQKQIELREIVRMEKMPEEEIFPKYETEGISLINNERECYLEACKMHNCVHSCYWRQILRGDYLVARGVVDGKYVDIGIRVSRTGGVIESVGLFLDQVHTIYNGMVSQEIQVLCSSWIDRNIKNLINITREIKKHCKVADPLPF